MEVHLRVAQIRDLGVLQEFQQNLVRHERPLDAGIPEEGMVEYYDLGTLIGSGKAHFLVAEHDDVIVGCGFGEVRENVPWAVETRFGYLGLMYVEEAHRHQGIGRQIAEAIIRWFGQQGISHIVTQAYSANVHAVEAYRKYGFRDFVMEMRYDPK